MFFGGSSRADSTPEGTAGSADRSSSLTAAAPLLRLPNVKGSPRPLSRRRIILARWIAIAVDFVQIVVFPVFSPGAVSPADDALDAATGAVMVGLVGWHWAFLPSFLTKLVPFVDLVPTWTAAVFLATRGQLSRNPGPRDIEASVVKKDSPPPPA